MEDQKDNNLIDDQTELLRRNLELSQEILNNTEYLKKYVKWQQVWGVLRILIIVIPIIIGFLYLPPLIKDYLDQVTSLYK